MQVFNKDISIEDFKFSENLKTFIIAEAGVNHNGDLNIAKQLIDAAKEAGVDAVKFQAFKTENLILKNVSKASYQLETTGSNESQFQMLKNLEISNEQNKELKEYCKKRDLIFLTTPFDEKSLEELDVLNLSAYKVASTDVTNLIFLEKVARKGKPIILSTGMASLADIEMALEVIAPINQDVILLQCTANYPIQDDEANLNVLHTFIDKFGILVGFSDHSVGIGASPYAVAMGARLVEKHFTLDKQAEGPDQRASLDPIELKSYVDEIRKVEKYLGSGIKDLTSSEQKTRQSLQKCLVALKEIKEGELFSESNIIAKRTGGIGVSPIRCREVFQIKATKDYAEDEIIEI